LSVLHTQEGAHLGEILHHGDTYSLVCRGKESKAQGAQEDIESCFQAEVHIFESKNVRQLSKTLPKVRVQVP
jgi:hypothetical protein